jgi:exonuclease VII small subunit
MKKTVYTLSLCLGILCFSCESNQNSSNDVLKKSSENKTVNAASRKIEVTKRPDTIIDGKQVYNFGKVNTQKKTLTLDEAINEFRQGVNNASSCDELIRACARFDTRIKQLSNSNVKVSEVEKRDDVRAIRKQSEEKSLKLCQTQQIR